MRLATLRPGIGLAALLSLALAAPVHAIDLNFTVNASSDEPDDDLTDNACQTVNGNCTLRAAIMEVSDPANPPDTLHRIEFGVSQVTLSNDLPTIQFATVIDGSGGGPRVEINGNGFGCFEASSGPGSGAGSPELPQANNTRFESLVVHNCGGLAAIELHGHGYAVSNSYIGTNTAGTAASATPNTGHGIYVSASAGDGPIPDLSGVPLPGELADIASIAAFIVAAAPAIAPTGIVGNVISGNGDDGIEISGKFAATTIIFDNKIGTNAAGDTGIGNGSGSGAGDNGITITAGAWMNFVGLDNVIAGNDVDPDSDGVHISTGAVPFPNFVLTNFIGTSPTSVPPFVTDLGNSKSGIRISDARPTTAADVAGDPEMVVNPLDLAAVIGPGNVIGHNKGDNGGLFDNPNQHDAGISVSGGLTRKVRIIGNLVGIADPTGSLVDIGNAGDGINVVGTEHSIGDDSLLFGNIVGANDRHGIVVRGGANGWGTVLKSNRVGTLPDVLEGTNTGNAGHGIWVIAGGTTIGGPDADQHGNVIAFNGMDGIDLFNLSSVYGVHIQRNRIYGVNTGAGFRGIDLKGNLTDNQADPTSNVPVTDRSASAFSYTNWQQNTITLSNPGSSGGSTTANWELRSALNGEYRIEFYASEGAAGPVAQTFICEINGVVTSTPDPDDPVAGGIASGSLCAGGNLAGQNLTAIVTDMKATSGGEPQPPGLGMDGPINNSSEISAPLAIPQQVVIGQANYSALESAGTVDLTVFRLGTVGAVSVDLDVVGGTAANGGVDYTVAASTPLSWNDGDDTPRTVTVTINPDSLDETDETVLFALASPMGAVLGDPSASTLTLTDDDAAPTISVADAMVIEPDAGAAALDFFVTLSAPSGFDVMVTYSTMDGSAIAPGDYTGASAQQVLIPAGQPGTTISIDAIGDLVHESDETFTLDISATNTSPGGDLSAIGTLQDNDAPPAFSITDASATEGVNPQIVFTVSKSGATALPASVDYDALAGTAATPADFDAGVDGLSGTLVFAPGDTQRTISLSVTNDAIAEPLPQPETFTVDLSNPLDATIADASGTGTITDDEGQSLPAITIDDGALVEGTGGTSTLTLNLSLSQVSASVVTVEASTVVGSADASDFTPIAGQVVTFPANTLSATLNIAINPDTIDEADESFTVVLANPVNGTTNDSALVDIQDDDNAPVITIDDVSGPEGTGGAGALGFTLNLSNPSDQTVTVDVTSVNGSADASDFTAIGGQTVSFVPGATSANLQITVAADDIDEGDESFTLNLANAVNGSTSDSATGTILDDDAAPGITIADAGIAEGTGGSTTLSFVLSLSNPSAQVVTVEATTVDVSADATDYTPLNAELVSFPAGSTSAQLDVVIAPDSTDENNETFMVMLGNPVNGTTSDSATGTIIDDDGVVTPDISIADASIAEGSGGATTLSFTLTLSSLSSQIVTVEANTVAGSAGAADFTALSSQLVTFPANTLNATLDVPINPDLIDESDETFTVVLANPVNATTADSAVGTIVDDDNAPVISIADSSISEGTGGTTSMSFTLSLSNPSAQTVSVLATSTNGTAGAADFTAVAAQMVSFAPGAVAATLDVAINPDAVVEPNETFTITLSGAVNGSTSDSATGTIIDDDAASGPGFAVADVALSEGNAGLTAFTFTVTRANDLTGTDTIQIASAVGGAAPATVGVDYQALSLTTLTFDPGVTSRTATVNVIGETAVEADETFLVQLSNASAGNIIDAQAIGTIVNDDAGSGPSFAINDVSQNEGDSGTSAFTFTVTRTNDLTTAHSVQVASAVGGANPATPGSDYTALALQTLDFAAGVPTRTVTVQVIGDTTVEPNETFVVNLANPSAGAIADAQGIGTVLNDDSAATPVVSLGGISQGEGNSGQTAFTFTLTRAPATGVSCVTVATAVGGGNPATPGQDFDPIAPTQFCFADGEATLQFTVLVNADTVYEGDETFLVVLSTGVNATIGNAQVVATILGDDLAPQGTATAVPTLSSWTLMLLTLLMFALGIAAQRGSLRDVMQVRSQRR